MENEKKIFEIAEKNGWTCTDGDCFQFRKTLDESELNLYYFIQIKELPHDCYGFISMLIDLDNYKDSNLYNDYLKAYYDDKNAPECSDDDIIAECIFETDCLTEGAVTVHNSLSDCIEVMEKFINEFNTMF